MRSIAVLLLLTAGFASAQGGGGMGGPGGGMGGMGGGMGAGGMGGMESGGGMMGGGMSPSQRNEMMLTRLAAQLELKKDQKKELKAIFEAGRKQMEPLDREVAETRARIREAVRTGGDPSEYYKRYGSAETAVVAAQAGIFSQILSILNDNQKKRADVAFNMIPMLTSAPRGGGPGERGGSSL